MTEPASTYRYCGCDDHYPESFDAAMHFLRMEADRLGPGTIAIADQAEARIRDLREQSLRSLIQGGF